MSERQGHCLCGAVKITATGASDDVGACHCQMCRRWGGGPFMEVDCGSDVIFEGEDKISVFKSSDWAERGFCKNCGTHLFYRIQQTGRHVVPIGLFEASDGLAFKTQVFIDEKPDYYAFANETDNMTGQEVFEKFGGSE